MSATIWLLDRALGLVSYPVLYLATLTGVLYDARGFGVLRDAARRVHLELATLALITIFGHAVVGTVDTFLVVDGQAPTPPYGVVYLLLGVAVGVGALFVVVVATLGFLDARRFQRPWSPRVVHAFAYAGFAFATVHAAAVGTDVVGLLRPLVLPSVVFLMYVVVLRSLQRYRAERRREHEQAG